jgi:histidine ammonia-lyase
MGMTSAMKLKQVVRNTRHVLAIELLTATRALDCLRPLNSSPIIEQVRVALARISPPWTADRSLTADIEKTGEWIASGALSGLAHR